MDDRLRNLLQAVHNAEGPVRVFQEGDETLYGVLSLDGNYVDIFAGDDDWDWTIEAALIYRLLVDFNPEHVIGIEVLSRSMFKVGVNGGTETTLSNSTTDRAVMGVLEMWVQLYA